MATGKLRDFARRLLQPVRKSAGSPALWDEAEPSLAATGRTPELPAPAKTSSSSAADTDKTDWSTLHWEPPGNSDGTACTQFSTTGIREKVDLVIGLDFGTSSAKVAVRSPYLGRGRATAVAWPDGHGGRSLLLPTNLSESAHDCRLRANAKPSPSDRSLKVALMENPNSVEARAMAAGYLAWVLRMSRSHILSSQQETYGSHSLRWTLNLGMPSTGHDEQIRRGFEVAARAAWALSVRDRPPTRSEAVAAVNRLCPPDFDPESLLDLTGVDVVPEVVAEAARYAQSDERRNGLHFLVDVGAWTVDCCGFVLHESEGEDHWRILNAVVIPLGVLRLHHDRLKALADAGCAIHPEVPPGDAGPFDPIPAHVRDYVADKGAPSQEAALVDSDYSKKVVLALKKVLWDLKKRRDPHSPHWRDGLLVFVAGGGGRLSILRQAISSAETDVRRHLANVADFRYADNAGDGGVPGSSPPNEEKGVPTTVRERMGVAYGLSLPNVGSITPPSDIDDVESLRPKPKPPPLDYWGGKR